MAPNTTMGSGTPAKGQGDNEVSSKASTYFWYQPGAGDDGRGGGGSTRDEG